MALYQYEVVDNQGNFTRGQLNEDNERSAIRKLRELGYTVTDIKEIKSTEFFTFLKFKPKVKLGDLSLFSRQLASMIDAGIPLTRALFTMSEQATNQTLKEAVYDVAENVEAGMSFSEALSHHPNIFSELYVSMIEVGEEGGSLEISLSRISEQLEKDKALRDNIRSATFYPALISAFAVVILIVMMIFIIPVFIGMIPEGVAMPLPTRIIIAVSDSIRNFWFLWVLAAGIVILSIRYFLSTSWGERSWSKVKLSLPIFGPLVQKAVVGRFARTLSTLLAGGVSVLSALEKAGKTAGNAVIEEAAMEAVESTQEGSSIAEPLRRSMVFPPMTVQMISVGEETGALAELLERIANFYEEEVETMSKGLTAMIEPLMLVGVGALIGFIVISMYLPIFIGITEVA